MTYNVNINGQSFVIEQDSVGYNDIVSRADSGRSKKCLHTITYYVRTSEDGVRQGTIYPGKTVKLAEGMEFSAYVTDNA